MTPQVRPEQEDPLVSVVREFQRVNRRSPSTDEIERMERLLKAPERPPAPRIPVERIPEEFRLRLPPAMLGLKGPKPAQEFAGTFAPSTTDVPVPSPTKALLPLTEAAIVGTFDDFLKLGERVASGEILTSGELPQLVIRPDERFLAGAPKPVREAVGFGGMAIRRPLETAAGLITLPYHIAHNAYRTLDPANIRPSGPPGIAYDIYARMTPDEADEARRALSAFIVSVAVAGPAGATVGRFAGALGTSAGVQRLVAAQAGAVTGASTFGLIEAPPGDQADRAIAYGLIALPIGFAFKMMQPLVNIKTTDIKGADHLGRMQKVRPFDEPAPRTARETPVIESAVNEAEATALTADAFKKAEAIAATRGETITPTATPGGFEVTGVRPTPPAPTTPSFFEQVHPDPRAERAAEARTRRLEIKAQNAIRSGRDLTNAIILNFRDLPDQQMTVATGLDNPGQALAIARQTLGKEMTAAVHRRPDGQFDVALGRPGSPLERNKNQFVSQGFVEGEAIYVDGKMYKYVNAAPADRVRLVDLGTGKELNVERNRVRRGPEASFVEFNPESRRLLEQALTERELKIYDTMFDALHKDGKLPEPSITRAAASNGLFVDRDNAGGHLVRDSQTGDILFRTPWRAEAMDFINRAGQRAGPDFSYGMGGVPPEIVSSIMPPPDQPPRPNVPMDLPPRSRISSLIDWFNVETPRFPGTAMGDWMSSFDNLHKTDLTNKVFIPTQNAAQARNANSRPFFDRLKKIEELVGDMAPADREIISDYREALSPKETTERLFKHRPLSPAEINAGKLLAGRNTDIAKIYKFQRMRDEVLFERARREKIPINEMPPEMRKEELIKLSKEMGMISEDLQAVRLFDEIRRSDLEDISLYAVTRYANALMSNTPTRAQFASRNRLTTKQIKIANEIDKLYEESAAAFGIDDASLIEGYMNHYLSLAYHGAITGESSFMWQRSKRLQGEVPLERRFVSDMIRSGELTTYTRDPIIAAFKYISAGFSAKDFTPVWERARADARNIINNLPGRRLKELTARIVHDTYLNELRGIPEAAVRFTQATTEEMFKVLGMDVSPDVRRQLVNTILATTNSAALGFRPALGFRDLADFTVRYGSLYGFDRAANGLKLAVEPGVVTNMRNKGLLPGALSPVEFSTAEELAQSGFGKLKNLPGYLGKIAEKGLLVSLQKNVYEIMHAAAYLDTRQVVLAELSKFVKEGQTKDQAFRRSKVYTYDPPIVRQFERLVDSGEVEGAADFLARATSRKIGYIYGQANHPYGWGTNVGRLAAQFGTWSVWSRNFFLRGLTQGTRADRAAFAVRFAMSQAAIGLAGSALGFNLYQWYLFPGLFFAGGPLVQTGLLAADLFSPFEVDRRIAKSRLLFSMPTINSPGSLFIPGSYMLGDIYKAFTQAENLVEFGGRAIGIPLAKGRSWIDEF